MLPDYNKASRSLMVNLSSTFEETKKTKRRYIKFKLKFSFQFSISDVLSACQEKLYLLSLKFHLFNFSGPLSRFSTCFEGKLVCLFKSRIFFLTSNYNDSYLIIICFCLLRFSWSGVDSILS